MEAIKGVEDYIFYLLFTKDSARSISKGVVSLMFSLFPSTISIGWPMLSTTEASSVKVSRYSSGIDTRFGYRVLTVI